MIYLLLGFAVALGAMASTAVVLWRLLIASQGREEVANDRLYAAWRDNYNIPANEPELTRKAIEDVAEPLIAPLQELVDDWEDDKGKESQRKYIKSMIDNGLTQAEVARQLRPDLYAEAEQAS